MVVIFVIVNDGSGPGQLVDSPQMAAQIPTLGENLAAYPTSVRLLQCVLAEVVLQVAPFLENGATAFKFAEEDHFGTLGGAVRHRYGPVPGAWDPGEHLAW